MILLGRLADRIRIKKSIEFNSLSDFVTFKTTDAQSHEVTDDCMSLILILVSLLAEKVSNRMPMKRKRRSLNDQQLAA